MIRKMLPEDKEAVFEMMRPFYNSPAVINTASDEILYQDIEDATGSMPFLEGFVFEVDEKIAGYSMVSLSYSTEYGGLNIWIEDLYVKPEFRRMGLAKEFFKFIENKYKAVRYKLEVEDENEIAIEVYKSCGYKHLPYLIMSKEI